MMRHTKLGLILAPCLLSTLLVALPVRSERAPDNVLYCTIYNSSDSWKAYGSLRKDIEKGFNRGTSCIERIEFEEGIEFEIKLTKTLNINNINDVDTDGTLDGGDPANLLISGDKAAKAFIDATGIENHAIEVNTPGVRLTDFTIKVKRSENAIKVGEGITVDAEGVTIIHDNDNDGIFSDQDPCPDGPFTESNPDFIPNTSETENLDDDEFADACDFDIDGDFVDNGQDNCPLEAGFVSNDGCPEDNSPPDADGDGIPDEEDFCDNVVNDDNTPNVDSDGDGFGDACDNCPDVANADGQNDDIDNNGVGDACDPDRDGDEVPNASDNCPDDTTPPTTDDDGDGCEDEPDTNPPPPPPGGGGGGELPDLSNPEGDFDGDEVLNGQDNCPTVTNPDQADEDGDGIGDVCDFNNDEDIILEADGTNTGGCSLGVVVDSNFSLFWFILFGFGVWVTIRLKKIN